jgi:protein-S-isoprenylcysteine O-methyltransferase Ste14
LVIPFLKSTIFGDGGYYKHFSISANYHQPNYSMTTAHYIELITLVVAWSIYGILHSLLASLRCKAWFRAHWPQQMYSYRIAFNISAVILLLPILLLEYSIDALPLWSWAGTAKVIALLIMAIAIGGFIWSTRYYDMSHFIGSRQWRNRASVNHAHDDDSTFTISPLHRFVRHPWYSLALLLLWSRDIESTTLVTNLIVSAYFIIGARLEEDKLVGQFGDQYQAYQQRVPAIVPRPWRYLSAAEASSLCTSNRPDEPSKT